MQRRSRKRKQTEVQAQPSPPIKSTGEPFPNHPHPTPEDCRAVRDDLLALHGFPKEFAKYRSQRLNGSALIPAKPEPFDGEHDQSSSGFNESVLDGLVSTVLSQNTTDVNSHRAFASLKSAFPTWEDWVTNSLSKLGVLRPTFSWVELVLIAESKSVENAIRCGGLAPTKASCIKNVLSCLLEKKGKLCLEYLRDLSVDEIKAELSQFKGIGPKTVACVLMFQLQKDDFPVDTHVFQIAKAIGWVPEAADTKKTYLHLNRRIPNELKFDLNCLLFTHGKLCQKCTKRGGNPQKRESYGNSCPLLNYCDISKSECNS
ncbi:putative DNA glycosylase At3g47830 isoform X1 [Camellia sinensis]|uniref:putative DNA glycosylase At3g47830 isoform X1 n=1 Tax=Camellia sinensis TaxID=4442 RepID=UPI0010369764|nr:putative DNA glycosylase At3g47830 isoform X1 [Camellia sinensis]